MSVDVIQVLGISAVVSGVVTGGVQFVTNRWQFDYQLRRQHRQDERRKLRELISSYHGRMLEAALDWDRRAAQLYDGHYDDLWPSEDCRLDHEQYYFQSVVFRFLQLMAVSRRFEGEAFYIDASIAEDQDFDLLRYAKTFLWVAIHAEISPNDGLPGIDHFRSDAFRPLLDVCYSNGDRLPETRTKQGELVFDLQRCIAVLKSGQELGFGDEVDEVLSFFSGLRPDEYDERDGRRRQRRRWDRVVALHLLVLAFIADCGYQWDAEDLEGRITAAVDMLLYPDDLRAEFATWLPRLGFKRAFAAKPRRRANSHGSKRDAMTVVAEALSVAAGKTNAETPAERASRVMSRVGEKPVTAMQDAQSSVVS